MRLSNERAQVSLQRLGAMLHDCAFVLDDGRTVTPLYDAPWRGDSGPDFDALPPIIRELGSEWPCVPFGRPDVAPDLPDGWTPADGADLWDDFAHGYGSNHDWTLERLTPSAARALIDYPDGAPIHRLERSVTLLADRAGLDLSLTVVAERDAAVPIGLHPVLAMDGAPPGSFRLSVPATTRAWTFPVEVEPGRSHFAPDQRSVPLGGLEDRTGAPVNARLMPPAGDTEDLLLLTGTGGRVDVMNADKGYGVSVQWEAAQFPGCLLWISNGGRDYYPWNSRVSALGVEPVAAPFDLGLAYAVSDRTPLARASVPTVVQMSSRKPFSTRYRIVVVGTD